MRREGEREEGTDSKERMLRADASNQQKFQRS